MRYPEDFDRSRLISSTALETMTEQRIPLNPANYTVWYAYAAELVPKLKKSLKALLTNKVAFTTERNNQIYEQFFGVGDEAKVVDAAGSQVQRCAEEIIQELRRARADQGDFGTKVGDLSGALSDAKDPGEIGSVVRHILVETQSILAKSRKLEQKLSDSTKEIENLREDLQDVRKESLTDALTGIANRKCFDQTLCRNATEAMENGTRLSFLLLDIDHFKRFNDTYGHAVGDSVLRVVAGQLKQSLKGQDLPARYGGEEFCILLPNTGLPDAVKVAEQVRTELAARALKNAKSNETYGSLTLSIGVAEFRFGEKLDDFVKRGDRALYRAKQSGRNKVVPETELETALSAAG